MAQFDYARIGSSELPAELTTRAAAGWNLLHFQVMGGEVYVVWGKDVNLGNVDEEKIPTEFTDGSGSITLGNTSQQIFASNASRRILLLQNISSEAMYLNFEGAATINTDSLKLNPNATVSFTDNHTPTGSVNIIAPSTGSKFIAKEV